jgi:succinyl-CoA synthetase beta subunit
MTFDDNALYRMPKSRTCVILAEEDSATKSRRRILAELTSSSMAPFGCMVNGAGLAMGDDGHHQLAGWRAGKLPATSAAAPTPSRSRTRFRILMSDKPVKAVLINIFGGILRCDVLRASVIAAATPTSACRVPIVHPHEGHNVELGKQMAQRQRPELHDRRHEVRSRRHRGPTWRLIA